MRKLLTCLLILSLFVPAVMAETAWEPLLMADADDPDVALDIIPHVPNPANFTDDSYEDETISVTMEHVMVGNARFNVARVKIVDPSQLRTEVEKPYKDRNNLVINMAARQNAVVAIGDDNYKGRSSYIVRMGKVMQRDKKPHGRDALLIDQNGDFTILKNPTADELTAVLEGDTPIINTFSFGPALVIDGELQEIPKTKDYANRLGNTSGEEPRCAIGQMGPLEYMMVVVDGRGQEGSDGCTTEVLAQFMYDQGCVQAYNLDGGNSADMYFGGGLYSHEKSTPRSLSGVIYFATLVDAGLDAEAE